jgi:hypothetical protein
MLHGPFPGGSNRQQFFKRNRAGGIPGAAWQSVARPMPLIAADIVRRCKNESRVVCEFESGREKTYW